MKQKKAKTKYKHDLCFAFVFIANKSDPLEKPFHKRSNFRIPRNWHPRTTGPRMNKY